MEKIIFTPGGTNSTAKAQFEFVNKCFVNLFSAIDNGLRIRRWIFAFVLILPLFCVAQDSATVQPSTDTTVTAVTGTTAVGESPVAVPVPSAKALRHDYTGNIIWAAETAWGFILPLIFLFTGLSVVIRNWSARLSKKKFLLIFAYMVFYSVILFIINLPIDYYTDFLRPHNYGLSDQTFTKWIGDNFKALGVGIIFGGLVINVLYWVLRKSPKRWWLYFGLLNIPITFFALLITPVFIEPLFNDFGPMKNKALETKILAQAERAGIEGGKVYEVNKSVDTKTLNAYVNGLGSTKRIVLWDNTIKQLSEQELLFVLGHEMGHYVLHHVVKQVLCLSLLTILLLFLAYKSSGWFLIRFGSKVGFNELSDIASLPLIMLILSLYSFILSPATNTLSRHFEHEADIFGLEITKNNHAAATAFVKLQQENLANPRPNPVIRFFRADHPPLGERIDFANTYKPWKTGEKMQFEECFKSK
jgi:STE24 endopeptidase